MNIELSAVFVPELADSASQVTIIALLALCGVCTLIAVLHRRTQTVALLASAGIGSILAYGLSEVLKVLIRQPRPCHIESITVDCPPLDDWSFPSNHSVIAFALATALVLMSWRLVLVTAPLAVLTAAGRVLSYEHFVHDVVLGGVLGVLIVLITVLALRRPLAVLLSRVIQQERLRSGELR